MAWVDLEDRKERFESSVSLLVAVSGAACGLVVGEKGGSEIKQSWRMEVRKEDLCHP